MDNLTFNHSYDGGTFENVTPEQAYHMGIEARNENKSVFDYPFDISDPYTDHWINGFMFRDKELRNV